MNDNANRVLYTSKRDTVCFHIDEEAATYIITKNKVILNKIAFMKAILSINGFLSPLRYITTISLIDLDSSSLWDYTLSRYMHILHSS